MIHCPGKKQRELHTEVLANWTNDHCWDSLSPPTNQNNFAFLEIHSTYLFNLNN